jgi:predicted  nucleic acid-binding Zn-ribbon protein
MIYIANHILRHNGQVFQKGEIVTGLTFEETQDQLRHGAISEASPEFMKMKEAAEAAAEERIKAREEAKAKAKIEAKNETKVKTEEKAAEETPDEDDEATAKKGGKN